MLDHTLAVFVLIFLFFVFIGGLALIAIIYAKGGSALITWYTDKLKTDKKSNTKERND